MTVVDASALLEILLQTSAAAQVSRILQPSEILCAPHLIDLEVTQALRRYVAANKIPPPRALEALEILANFPLERHPHLPLLGRIWDLRANLTTYEAAYVALAEELDARLVTCDKALAHAPGHHARVHFVKGS